MAMSSLFTRITTIDTPLPRTGMSLNKNNSAVKRIMHEARELANDPCTDYTAAPLEEDIFEWHCTIRGPPGTEFEGGLYHCRVLLPAEYPFRPPSIMMLTPNGRFELNTKICISFTNYHEELWQPAWGVRTAILGLQGFFPIKGQAAAGVGSIECPTSERKRLATQSRNWTCPHCQKSNVSLLPDPASLSAGSLKVFAHPQSNPGQVISHAERTATSSLDNTSSAVPESPSSSLHGEEGLLPKSTVQVGLTESVQSGDKQRNTWRRTNRPPASLDAAISILLVLLFVIICRRMV